MTTPGISDVFVNFARDLRDRGLEFVSGRYLGKYGGVVVDNDDPQGQGRIRVKCKSATGRDDTLDIWAAPSSPYAGRNKGFFFPPDAGDSVWVWFDHGDPTQPRYSGSWWRNSDTLSKARAKSQIPAEFKTATGGPTTRGFKTGRGHGLLIEDDPNLGARIELWTGEPNQFDLDGVATRHHQFVLADTSGAEKVAVYSNGGQVTEWIDIAGQLAIQNRTKNGFFLKILDSLKQITMGGPKGFIFTIDELGGKVVVDTPKGFFSHILETDQKITMGGPLGFAATIDEKTGAIVLQTPAGKMLQLDETGQRILLTDAKNSVTLSPTGVSLISAALMSAVAAAAITLTAGAGMALASGGPMALTAGGGLAIASPSAAPCTTFAGGISNNIFTGLKTENILGGLIQTIVGAWVLSSGSIDLEAPLLTLGFGGTKFALIDVRFLDLFNAHVHPVTVLGAPSGPPLAPVLPGAANTSAVAAN